MTDLLHHPSYFEPSAKTEAFDERRSTRDGLGHGVRNPHHRHAELVSASICQRQPRVQSEEWTLKQVQGDSLLIAYGVAVIGSSFRSRTSRRQWPASSRKTATGRRA